MIETAVSEAREGRRQGAYPAAVGLAGADREQFVPSGAGMLEPAREKMTDRALDETQRAARLLERALVSAIEQEELHMPALERIYAALLETEAAAAAIETQPLAETAR